MTLVKPKAETREAWQYTGQPRSEWPAWVQSCVRHPPYSTPAVRLLYRRSGAQMINPTDWLIRNLDGDPDWLTHDQMRKTFDEVAP